MYMYVHTVCVNMYVYKHTRTECCLHVARLIHHVCCCSAVPAIAAGADGDEPPADLSPVPLAAQTHDGEY